MANSVEPGMRRSRVTACEPGSAGWVVTLADGCVFRYAGSPLEVGSEPLHECGQLTDAASRFHEHLDKCAQCRESPFNLCAEGRPLLEAAGGSN